MLWDVPGKADKCRMLGCIPDGPATCKGGEGGVCPVRESNQEE
jgi:hypothetical protein